MLKLNERDRERQGVMKEPALVNRSILCFRVSVDLYSPYAWGKMNFNMKVWVCIYKIYVSVNQIQALLIIDITLSMWNDECFPQMALSARQGHVSWRLTPTNAVSMNFWYGFINLQQILWFNYNKRYLPLMRKCSPFPWGNRFVYTEKGFLS